MKFDPLQTIWTPTVAVDPGLSGSVALLRYGPGPRSLDLWRGFDTLRDLAVAVRLAALSVIGNPNVRFIIEQVHAMPGQGVCSMFSFGRGTGTAFGAWMAMWPENPVYEVTPQKWQNWYREFIDIPKGAGTFDSTVVAPQVLTPDMLDRCRKVRGSLDHNACDAALMAVYASVQNQEDLKVSEHWRAPVKVKKVGRKQSIEKAVGLHPA